MMSPPPAPWRETAEPAFTAVRSGLRFVRGRVWLWGTLLSAAFAYLVFLGPAEVLLPYVVKNDLHASAGALGLVFAAGGLGAVGAAIVMAQRREPRRNITFMYATWTLATLAVAGYGLATSAWQLMIACLAFNALETAGTIVWATLKQRHVPASMLGRVSSLDWMISIGLLPLSFALTAPAASRLRCSGDPHRVGPARRRDHARSSLPPRHAGSRASAHRPENAPPGRRTVAGSRLTVRRSS